MTTVLAEPDAASQIAGLAFAVVLLDPHNIIAKVNPAAEDLLGRSAQRLTGVSVEQVLQVTDVHVQRALLNESGALVARDVVVRVGHRPHHVDIVSSPLPTHPGWRTISLSEAGQGGDAADDALELRTPAILAHEIKNPLAAIRGASQLLARRVEPGDRPLAAIITTEVDRIAGLIDRMQQLGSAQSAGAGPCNLHEAIRSAIATVRAARPEEAELIEAFDPSLPPVAADAAALEQIVINLVANACDACATVERPRVEVRTRYAGGLAYNITRLGKTIRLPIKIVVADNGPGIDPALQDHIFEPFVTGKRGGQGLGLALVRKLVRDMGGRIAQERDERAGLTLFRINLAVATARADGEEA